MNKTEVEKLGSFDVETINFPTSHFLNFSLI